MICRTWMRLLLVVLVLSNASCRRQQSTEKNESKFGAKSNTQTAADLRPDKDGWLVVAGDPVPPIELVDPFGKIRSLDEFKGLPVVLLFWGTT